MYSGPAWVMVLLMSPGSQVVRLPMITSASLLVWGGMFLVPDTRVSTVKAKNFTL